MKTITITSEQYLDVATDAIVDMLNIIDKRECSMKILEYGIIVCAIESKLFKEE